MAALLREAAKHGIASTYTNKLLAAYKDGTKDEGQTTEHIHSSPVLGPSSFVESLSERELDVLRLLGTELSGPEIARELMVSPNTMRTHTRNIYSKLGVHNRRAAVRRAEELDLL
jgi:LuxR family maltose regulon positive regulatory protein